jgi:hypothetical protein
MLHINRTSIVQVHMYKPCSSVSNSDNFGCDASDFRRRPYWAGSCNGNLHAGIRKASFSDTFRDFSQSLQQIWRTVPVLGHYCLPSDLSKPFVTSPTVDSK